MGITGPRADRDVCDIDLDLGFGKFISSKNGGRLLHRDGTFNVRRSGLGFFERISVYHFRLEISWPRFLGLAALWYILANAAFAAVFFALGPEALNGIYPSSALVAFFAPFLFSLDPFSPLGSAVFPASSLHASLYVRL